MNISKTLFHNVGWFLRENDTSKLKNYWKNEIKQFINMGYRKSEFEVSINNEHDSLIWKILK